MQLSVARGALGQAICSGVLEKNSMSSDVTLSENYARELSRLPPDKERVVRSPHLGGLVSGEGSAVGQGRCAPPRASVRSMPQWPTPWFSIELGTALPPTSAVLIHSNANFLALLTPMKGMDDAQPLQGAIGCQRRPPRCACNVPVFLRKGQLILGALISAKMNPGRAQKMRKVQKQPERTHLSQSLSHVLVQEGRRYSNVGLRYVSMPSGGGE
ncbi:hypothetical protein BC826DRAFT_1044238 [Russula brevipes]|nr:hypothetical protein BC826DRAFT_1084902 [Russula brevipes]KAI0287434.1 hypothetical protein BC826DRAFT_1044238 [Russula brevipes]